MSDYERQSDALLISLDQKFKDFIDRYERDQDYAQRWRVSISDRIKNVEEFLIVFKPTYKRTLWIVGAIVLGSIGYWVKWFWAHVKWN